MTQIQQINLQEIFDKAQRSSASLNHLLKIGRTRGFENTINRRLIWPFLLGLNAKQISQKTAYEWLKSSELCLQYDLIKKDADRSLVNLQTFEITSSFHIMKKQKAVLTVLNSIFLQNRQINYLQGFHSIAATILTLFDNSSGYYLIKSLTTTYFYDFLTFDFKQVAESLSAIIYELIVKEDASFKKYLQDYQAKKILVFMLPWMITWFSQTISNLKSISRIWDYILCTGPTGIIYLVAAFILCSKNKLQVFCQSFNEAEIQEFFQQKMKKTELDLVEMIETALFLEESQQISSLDSYKNLNPKSMYRTENFSKILSIHTQFHEKRRKQIQTSRRIGAFAKVGGVVLVLATAFLIKKHSKLNLFKQ